MRSTVLAVLIFMSSSLVSQAQACPACQGGELGLRGLISAWQGESDQRRVRIYFQELKSREESKVILDTLDTFSSLKIVTWHLPGSYIDVEGPAESTSPDIIAKRLTEAKVKVKRAGDVTKG